MTTIEARHACTVGALLGQRLVRRDDPLWFTDIERHHLHRYRSGNGIETWVSPAQVGWVPPAVGGSMLAGLRTGIHHFDLATGGFAPLLSVEPDRPGDRLNASSVDPAGRLWFGSMDDRERAPTGRIYCADTRGVLAVADGIAITNGPAVSSNGATLYHGDTLRGIVHACDLDGDGDIVATRVFLAVDVARRGLSGRAGGGRRGHVWIAFHGGWRPLLPPRRTPSGAGDVACR